MSVFVTVRVPLRLSKLKYLLLYRTAIATGEQQKLNILSRLRLIFTD